MRLILCAAAAVLTGCTHDDPAAGRVSVRDSSGVAIAENLSAPDANMDWHVQESPELDLGRADGDTPDVFGRVRHAIRTRSGEIVVADASARELRFFDQGGRHLRTFGRQGEGPGEFVNLWWMAETRGDSIAAIDNLGGRVSIFTRGGEFARSYPIPRIPAGLAPNVAGLLRSGAMVMSTRARPAQPASRQSSMLVYTVDADGAIPHELGEYPGWELGANALPLGFGSAPEIAVGDSVIWYGHSGRFELRAFDAQGSLLRIVRLDRTPAVVTANEVAEARAAVREDLQRQGASGPAVQRILDTEFATMHPVHGRMIVDETGRLWVARYRSSFLSEYTRNDDREAWDVFDQDGRLQGYLVMPPDFRVTQIGEDYLLGVHTDSLGVQRVRVYRFAQTPLRN